MSWFEKLWKPNIASPQGAVIHTKLQPLVVNPGEGERIIHAKYRLDAIRRYIEQTEVISATKRAEFLAELRDRGGFLLKEQKLSEADYSALEALIKAGM